MSKNKQVTESMLKAIIEEVLNEEQLNEFKIDLGTGEETINSFSQANKKKISDPVKKKAELQSLAQAGGDPNKLDLTDISASTGAERATAQHIANKPGTSVDQAQVQQALSGSGGGGGGALIPGVADPSTIQKTGAGLMKSADVIKELKKIIAAYAALPTPPTAAQLQPIKDTAKKYQVALAAQSKVQSSVQKLFDKIQADLAAIATGGGGGGSATGIDTAIKNLARTLADVEALFNPAADTDSFTSPQLDLPYHSLSDTGWTKSNDIQTSAALPNTTVQIILTELSRFNMNFVEMFEHYKTLGDLMVDATSSTSTSSGSKNTIKAMPAEELFTSISVMSTLDYITNAFQGSSAGPVYETLQALLAGGVVFGGAMAGADVLMGKKGQLWISNKNTQLGKATGSAAVSGSQAKTNIHAIELNETMWYVGFGKAGAGAADSNKGKNTMLKIFIVGIKRIANSNNASSFNAVDVDGNNVQTGLTTASSGKYSIPFSQVKSSTIDIPIRSIPDVDFSLLASDAIEKAQDATQIAIRDIYVKLENIEKRTQTFLALHARKTTTPAEATAAKAKAATAASSAATDYKDLKTNLKAGFGGVDPAAGAKFNESKKVTPADLKKIISETFKK